MTLRYGHKSIPLVFILMYAVAMWGGQYALRGLWEPDEARYTYVAQEMARSDSWMVPIRNGEPYTHKPPLMFWLIRLATVFTGGEYNGIAGRFPSLLGAVLALWATARLAFRWFDAETAWRSLFILSTSALFWIQAGYGQIDMLLLGLEMMAVYLLFQADDAPGRWNRPAAFCFMGLAVLAKGPVGLAVPIGIYVFTDLFSGNRKTLRKTYWLWGIPLALAFPAAWLLGAFLEGAPPEFFNELLFAQNVGRVTGKFGGHDRPIYYYLQYLFIHFLPWLFFLPISLAALRRDAGLSVRRKGLIGWMLFVVVFFSLIASKRDIYILSVYPAAAILVAAAWPHLNRLHANWRRYSVYPLMGILLILGAACLLMPLVAELPVAETLFIAPGIVLAAGAVMLTRRFVRYGLDAGWFNRLVAVFIAAGLAVGMIVMPGFDQIKTPVQLAEAAPAILQPDQPLLLYQMKGEILALYSNRRGKVIDGPGELFDEMKRQKTGLVVFKESKWIKLRDRLAWFGTAQKFRMGSKDFYYFRFDVQKSRGLQRCSLRTQSLWTRAARPFA